MTAHHARNGFLTAKGLKEAEQRGVDRAYELSLEGLAQGDDQLYLDSTGSVSGLSRVEIKMIFDDGVIDEQFRRNFLGVVS